MGGAGGYTTHMPYRAVYAGTGRSQRETAK
jgi:hypothetical protein